MHLEFERGPDREGSGSTELARARPEVTGSSAAGRDVSPAGKRDTIVAWGAARPAASHARRLK